MSVQQPKIGICTFGVIPLTDSYAHFFFFFFLHLETCLNRNIRTKEKNITLDLLVFPSDVWNTIS